MKVRKKNKKREMKWFIYQMPKNIKPAFFVYLRDFRECISAGVIF